MAVFLILVIWILIGYVVMHSSSSFSIFGPGPSHLEFVLVLPLALLCYVLDKFRKRK